MYKLQTIKYTYYLVEWKQVASVTHFLNKITPCPALRIIFFPQILHVQKLLITAVPYNNKIGQIFVYLIYWLLQSYMTRGINACHKIYFLYLNQTTINCLTVIPRKVQNELKIFGWHVTVLFSIYLNWNRLESVIGLMRSWYLCCILPFKDKSLLLRYEFFINFQMPQYTNLVWVLMQFLLYLLRITSLMCKVCCSLIFSFTLKFLEAIYLIQTQWEGYH